ACWGGRAGGLEGVNDAVGEAQDGREFDRAGEFDYLDGHAARAEVLCRQARVLRRDVEHAAALAVRFPLRGDGDAAAANLQIERLQNVRAGFEKHVATDDAAVRDAVLDVDRHVRGLD